MYILTWKIGNNSGHGEYFEDLNMLRAWVILMNNEYGIGTHWITAYNGEVIK